MKICFFTQNYYKGGLDTFFINLMNAWPDQLDDLTLMCNASHPGLETIVSKLMRPVCIIKYSRVFTSKFVQSLSFSKVGQFFVTRFLVKFIYRILYYPILLPWYLISLTITFRRSDFDRLMVVNGGYPGSLLCRCAAIAWRLSGKRPLAIFNFHSLAIKPFFMLSWIENLIDLVIVQSVSQIVSVSQAALDSLINRKSFLGILNTRYIYNGITDPAQYKIDDKICYEGGDGSYTNYCLMLATYSSYKGHLYLLSAFKLVLIEFPDIKLFIYGYGKAHDIKQVEEDVKNLDLERNVILNGFVPDPYNLISNARMVVVPSQAFESFGLTIIEAMALSTPIVATDVGGIPEVLAGTDAGYICSKSDPLKFAEAMKRIIRDFDLAKKLGENGRKAFQQRFAAPVMAQKYEALLK